MSATRDLGDKASVPPASLIAGEEVIARIPHIKLGIVATSNNEGSSGGRGRKGGGGGGGGRRGEAATEPTILLRRNRRATTSLDSDETEGENDKDEKGEDDAESKSGSGSKVLEEKGKGAANRRAFSSAGRKRSRTGSSGGDGSKSIEEFRGSHGTIILTNYRLFFIKDAQANKKKDKKEEQRQSNIGILQQYQVIPVPLACIASIEQRKYSNNVGAVELYFKDHRYQTVRLIPRAAIAPTVTTSESTSEDLNSLVKLLRAHVFCKKLTNRFAFFNQENAVRQQHQPDGWLLFDARAEFVDRQGATKELWKCCKVNAKYKLCATYPSMFWVPKGMSEKQLQAMADCRKEGRIPVLSWKQPTTKVSLWRAEKLMRKTKGDLMTTAEESGVTVDTSYLRAIGATNDQSKEVAHFKDFPELTFKESLSKLRYLCAEYGAIATIDVTQNTTSWKEKLKETKWPTNGMLLLKYTLTVIQEIEQGKSVVLESSDGRDTVAQIVSLAQICLDPYYRTLKGFAVLVEKEWMWFGTDFGQRQTKKFSGASHCAHFIAFLDVLWRIVEQFPNAFEFNEDLLLFVGDSVFDARFGTFLYDNEKQRITEKISEKTVSLWSYIMAHTDQFLNKEYIPVRSPVGSNGADAAERKTTLIPYLSSKFWYQYFLRPYCKDALNIGNDTTSTVTTMSLSRYFLCLFPSLSNPNFSTLRSLDLAENNINTLPFSLSQLSHLSHLDLSRNNLENIPESFFESLSVSTSSLTKNEKAERLGLTFLSLASNDLRALPSSISSLCNLSDLNLSHNSLTIFPSTIAALSRLTRLNASHNNILRLRKRGGVSALSELRELNLSHNKLYEYPAVLLKNHVHLEKLYLKANQLACFPAAKLANLSRLEVLDLRENMSLVQPASSSSSTEQDSSPSTKRSRSIASPQDLSRKRTDSGNSKVTPAQRSVALIESLCSSNATLRELYVHGLRLRPADEAKNVEAPLPFLPALSHLRALSQLDLSHATLTALPAELFALTALSSLILDHNGLANLPPNIAELKQLTRLSLGWNELSTLPPELGYLKELKTLSLAHNKGLKALPVQLGFLAKLEELDLAGIKGLTFPPKELLKKGSIDPILSFLRHAYQGLVPLYRMKLMIVGQENAGKTTLLKHLKKRSIRALRKGTTLNAVLGGLKDKGVTTTTASQTTDAVSSDDLQDFLMNISTDGIDIEELFVPITKDQEKQKVQLSVWDFAGQELYYTTHQFFLSERSLYVLVFNLVVGFDNGRLDHWLHSVKARAGSKAPIIIVGTHADDPKCTEEYLEATRAAISAKFLSSRRFASLLNRQVHFVSCTTGKGMDRLFQDIASVLEGQRHMGRPMPKSYLQLEKELLDRRKELNPPILQWQDYVAVAKLCGIQEEQGDLLTATEVLHNLGSIVHFEDAKLRELVILDPQWLTKVMSSIITTKHNYAKTGVLMHKVLAQLWRAPDFPLSVHPFLLSLLTKFEIVFKLEGVAEDDGTEGDEKEQQRQEESKEERSLVPSLLPEERPDKMVERQFFADKLPGIQRKASPGPSHTFGRFYFFEFVPSGFFSRIMVRLLSFQSSLENLSARLYWRYGLIATIRRNKQKTADILLIEHIEKEKKLVVLLRLSSENSMMESSLYNMIIGTVEGLIQDWYELEGRVEVPCSHCVEKITSLESIRRGPVDVKSNSNSVAAVETNNNRSPTDVGEEVFTFPLSQCQMSILKGEAFVYCRGEKPIRLDQLVPDVVMSNIEGKRISYKDLYFESKIGEGSFASVYKGIYNGETVAIKQLKDLKASKKVTESEIIKVFDNFRHEVWLMNGISHPNLLNFKGFCMDPLCIVTEFIPGGNLFDYIHGRGPSCYSLGSEGSTSEERSTKAKEALSNINFLETMDWPLRLKIAKDMAKGMAYLHSTSPPTIHSDFKSPNILLMDLSKDASVVAKVCDFGLANNVGWQLVGRKVFNPVWLAPEIMRGEEYNTKADVYAYGVVLWELLTGKEFMASERFFNRIEKHVTAGQREEVPADCPVPEYVQLLTACWSDDPHARPSFKRIVMDVDRMLRTYFPAHADYDAALVGGGSGEKSGTFVKRTIERLNEYSRQKKQFSRIGPSASFIAGYHHHHASDKKKATTRKKKKKKTVMVTMRMEEEEATKGKNGEKVNKKMKKTTKTKKKKTVVTAEEKRREE
ncbi:Myotubularin-like phosphatase domain [Balamuthia mandrillaris]